MIILCIFWIQTAFFLLYFIVSTTNMSSANQSLSPSITDFRVAYLTSIDFMPHFYRCHPWQISSHFLRSSFQSNAGGYRGLSLNHFIWSSPENHRTTISFSDHRATSTLSAFLPKDYHAAVLMEINIANIYFFCCTQAVLSGLQTGVSSCILQSCSPVSGKTQRGSE